MTTYGSIRVSTSKQDTDKQRHTILEYANKKNLKNIIFSEDTASRRIDWSKRELGKLLNSCQKGDSIILAEVSRIGYGVGQVFNFINECVKKEVKIYIANIDLALDNKISTQCVAFAFGLHSQIEADLISDRTKRSLAAIKDKGGKVGRKKGSLQKSHKLDSYRDKIKEYLLVKKYTVTTIKAIINDKYNLELDYQTFTNYIKRHKLKTA